MRHLIYLALDSEAVCAEAAASIRSLHHVAKNGGEDYRITVYTNKRAFFEALLDPPMMTRITFRPITPAELTEWIGPKRYVYRAKICALLDHVSQHAEAALFVDADTFFTCEPGPLFARLEAGCGLLCYEEHQLGELVRGGPGGKNRAAHRFFHDLYQKRGFSHEGIFYPAGEAFSLFNSGVIGVPAEKAGCLAKALQLCDGVYERYRLRTAEQFALTWALQDAGPVESADEIVFHYWFLKEGRYLLEQSLGVTPGLEEKHLDSDAVQTLLSTSSQGLPLKARIAKAAAIKWGPRFPFLLTVISPRSHTGALLRQNSSR